MRNFVIINGVNSNTINGLGINELPPITKPEMRNIREEIDGRDGDIITELGYSAYDKTITIGLFGTGYDINNIVAFFNGEGTIVFSNEDDKYYKYKILNQIDYESLQKFRTASITFHCQPFKYPLSETPLEIEYDYIEDEGETLSLNNTGNATMKLDLKGNTSQSGTPTPTSPIPVSVVSGDNDVVVCGKNLWNIQAVVKGRLDSGVVGYADGTTNLTLNDDSLSFTTNTAWRGITTGIICVSPSTKYTFSSESSTSGTTMQVAYYDEYGTYIFNGTVNAVSDYIRSFTTSGTTRYIRIGIQLSSATTYTMTKPQLEKSNDIATSYEPYQSQTYEVDLPVGLELCKIGDYQDRIYKDNGNWYLYKEIGKVVLDGTNISATKRVGIANSKYGFAFNYDNAYRDGAYENGVIVCDRLLNEYRDDVYNNTQGIAIAGTNDYYGTGCFVYIADTGTMSVNDFNTWLQSHIMTVYYVLATPYLSLIEDNNLIEQLDNIQNAMSYEGTTNIGQVNNDKAFIISAKALEDGTNEVVVNNIGNVYSKPLIALEGSGNVDIYLDNTQILKANVESKMNIDINTLEAYNPDTSALLNRQVIGNYNSMTFQPGNNKLTINGSLSKATITNYTRWL